MIEFVCTVKCAVCHGHVHKLLHIPMHKAICIQVDSLTLRLKNVQNLRPAYKSSSDYIA